MDVFTASRNRPSTESLARKYYFPFALILLLFLSLTAFWDNLVTDIGQPSNSDPKMIVHGLFALAWVVILVLQAWFARTGRIRLHRRLGTAGFVIAVGVALSTIYLFVAVWKGWAATDAEARVNRVMLPSFALLVMLGYLNRRRPEMHKRLVFAGTLFLLEPILARCFDPLIVPLLPAMLESQVDALFEVFLFVSWAAFFLSLLAYDLLTLRRLHRVSLASFAWATAVNGSIYLA